MCNIFYSQTFKITGSHVSISNGRKPSGSVVGYIGVVIIILLATPIYIPNYTLVIIIISFYSILVAVIIYLIVGGVYMYMIRGARGVEVVPHLNYWTEVPLLVKVHNEILRILMNICYSSYGLTLPLIPCCTIPLTLSTTIPLSTISLSLTSLSFTGWLCVHVWPIGQESQRWPIL